MRNYRKFSFLLFLLAACNADDHHQEQEFLHYWYYTNSEVNITERNGITIAGINNGSKLVFEFQYSLDRDPEIIDDEYGEQILFEVEPDKLQFEYKDQQLLAIKAYFNCTFPGTGSISLNRGSIKGEKTSENTWELQIDVEFLMAAHIERRQLGATFVLN